MIKAQNTAKGSADGTIVPYPAVNWRLVGERIMGVIQYVTEEVRRQGHDVTKLDGIQRVGWMLQAWGLAIQLSQEMAAPEIEDVINLAEIIEPGLNEHGVRTVGVRVGGRICPAPDEVMPRLERLWAEGNLLTPVEFYKEFELIHPFCDGNGRAGKILLNWLNNTLLDPIFPPSDLFGAPILNP